MPGCPSLADSLSPKTSDVSTSWKCRMPQALQIALYVRTLLSWEGLVLRARMSCSNRAIASARLLGAAAVNARQSEARFRWGCITGRSSRWEGLGLAFGRRSLWARTRSSCHWWTPAARTFSCCKIKSSRDAIWSRNQHRKPCVPCH